MSSSTVSTKARQTRRMIAEKFMELMKDKPFRKVSINDICESALIRRSTFYLHFEDKYQLLRYCLEENASRWLAAAKNMTAEDAITCALDSILENKNFYYHIFMDDSNKEELSILLSIFTRIFTEKLAEKEQAGCNLPGPVSILGAFYAGGIVSANVQWIQSDFNIPKEEIVACQKKLLFDVFG